MDRIPIIVITGATASGKTSLSIELAKSLGGEIVSADSMQIYKYMDIGTAKPTIEERENIPHHLLDIISPFESYSVADYVKDASCVVSDIYKRGKLPIVTGGTGLYVTSLVNDVDFDDTCDDPTLRDELFEIAKREGANKLLEILSEFDEISAKELHPNNVRRIVRAIEFYKTTGKTISEHKYETKLKKSRFESIIFSISHDRGELYQRIEKRVDAMIEQGLTDEVKKLIDMGCSKKLQSMQAIGYKQLLDYFSGLSTFDEAIRIIKRDSRRYAKRQLTWIRRDDRVIYLDSKGDILNNALSYIKDFKKNIDIFNKI